VSDASKGKQSALRREVGEPAAAERPAAAGSQLTVAIGGAEPEDDAFVPEEEEQGAEWREGVTQGDHLMMAKSKMRRQRSVGSPGLDSPSNPFTQQGLSSPASPFAGAPSGM
jgi:hypothetical protein